MFDEGSAVASAEHARLGVSERTNCTSVAQGIGVGRGAITSAAECAFGGRQRLLHAYCVAEGYPAAPRPARGPQVLSRSILTGDLCALGMPQPPASAAAETQGRSRHTALGRIRRCGCSESDQPGIGVCMGAARGRPGDVPRAMLAQPAKRHDPPHRCSPTRGSSTTLDQAPDRIFLVLYTERRKLRSRQSRGCRLCCKWHSHSRKAVHACSMQHEIVARLPALRSLQRLQTRYTVLCAALHWPRPARH